MLPDFETMVRVPLTEVRDPDIQRGVDLHHRTDETFHQAPAFLAFCARSLDELAGAGVRRLRAVVPSVRDLDPGLAQALLDRRAPN